MRELLEYVVPSENKEREKNERRRKNERRKKRGVFLFCFFVFFLPKENPKENWPRFWMDGFGRRDGYPTNLIFFFNSIFQGKVDARCPLGDWRRSL